MLKDSNSFMQLNHSIQELLSQLLSWVLSERETSVPLRFGGLTMDQGFDPHPEDKDKSGTSRDTITSEFFLSSTQMQVNNGRNIHGAALSHPRTGDELDRVVAVRFQSNCGRDGRALAERLPTGPGGGGRAAQGLSVKQLRRQGWPALNKAVTGRFFKIMASAKA